MTDEDEESIRQTLKDLAKDGRVSCREALDLAARLGVPPRRIGKVADEIGLKIRACQLGLF